MHIVPEVVLQTYTSSRFYILAQPHAVACSGTGQNKSHMLAVTMTAELTIVACSGTGQRRGSLGSRSGTSVYTAPEVALQVFSGPF